MRMMMMVASWKSTLFVFLLWVIQRAVCRDVTLPPGPLYRVEGFPLSLLCTVSDYAGPRTQDFEWFLYRDDSHGLAMQVVSTRNTNFPYAPYLDRVKNGEVRIERDSGDKVRLVIQKLRLEDEGKYECYTPSTDIVWSGMYKADVTVKVIPDTLQITCVRSLIGQPISEGAELRLTCSASIQYKYDRLIALSVTFGKRIGAGGVVREIISNDKSLGVIPGSSGSYMKRYHDGEITLQRRNGEAGWDQYVMKMSRVQPEDTGSYIFEASVWIWDPNGSWEKISQRKLDIGNLTVQRLAESLSVTTSPRGEVTLQVGSPLVITCEVSGLPSGVNSGLLIQWMKRGSGGSDVVGTGGVEVEVTQISPGGVVRWGGDLSRVSGGSVEKVAEGVYSLKLFFARPSDSGVYRCVASVYAGMPNPSPSTAPTVTQRSEGVTFDLNTKDVLVSAVAGLPPGPLLKRGSTITLICNVTVTTTGPAQVQVQWLQRPIPRPLIQKGQSSPSELLPPVEEKPRLVAALSYEGLTRIYSNDSEVSIDRLSAAMYRLRVHTATADDQGLYTCQAEVFGRDPHGGWYNTKAKAQSPEVTVYLYAQMADLLLIPLVGGVTAALFVGILIVATVTCCHMKRLARQRARK